MSRVWSKFDEKGLARFVLPEAVNWLRLPLNRGDLADTPEGRRRLIEAIYTALVASQIRYAPEKYHSELAEQHVRSPFEILTAPGEGTCLDLAALFAGLCLGNELVPIVIVTETHALCVVSLTHSARRWDAFDRPERESFEQPVTDPEVLYTLLGSGSALAVECTGFAHSETLPPDSIEGAKRRYGVLSFPDAVEAGQRQLGRVDSPLRFAIDVAVAHYHWKVTPPTLPPEHRLATERLVAEQVTSGLRLDRERTAATVHPYPRPVAPQLRSPLGFVDRHTELEYARGGLAAEGSVWVGGQTGIGKTALLRKLAFDYDPDRYRDGVVYLSNIKDFDDAAQQVWESFFHSDPGYKPTLTRIGQAVGDLGALILLDDTTPAATAPLYDLLPNAGFAVVSSTDQRGEGTAVALEGLDETDAVQLFEQHTGGGSSPEERPVVAEVCRLLSGHPAKIIDAARAVADGETTVLGLVAKARSSSETPSRDRFASLGPIEQQVVALLSVFADTGLVRTHLEALATPDAGSALARLADRGIVETASPRYRLAATWMREIAAPENLEETRRRATRYFAGWARDATLEALAESLPELVAVTEWAQQDEAWHAVLEIGSAAEKAASLARRWGAWGTLLEAVRAAATHLENPTAEAYALHQLGSRAHLLGDSKTARKLLRRARRIRRRIGDNPGAQLAKHNLRIARPPWLPVAVVAAILTVAAGGVAAACTLTDLCTTTTTTTTTTITPAALEVIEVTPAQASIPVGHRQQLAATGHFSDGTTEDLTGTVIWTSSDERVATVNDAGLVNAVREGEASITALHQDVRGTAGLTVTEPVLEAIVIQPAEVSIPAGHRQLYTATGHLSDGTTEDLTDTTAWASSDERVARVDEPGLVSAEGEGEATITATHQGVTGTAIMTVTRRVLEAIVVQPPDATIGEGQTWQYQAIGHYSDGTTDDLTDTAVWASSNEEVATVEQGLATGEAPGETTISATHQGTTGTATLTVLPTID